MNPAGELLEMVTTDSQALTTALDRYGDACGQVARATDAARQAVEEGQRLVEVARWAHVAAIKEQIDSLRALSDLSVTLSQQVALASVPQRGPATLDH